MEGNGEESSGKVTGNESYSVYIYTHNTYHGLGQTIASSTKFTWEVRNPDHPVITTACDFLEDATESMPVSHESNFTIS